jgi:hypothetical protein
MFRKTIITATIAAAAFVAFGSPTPASAGGLDCFTAPAHCAELDPVIILEPVESPVVVVEQPTVPEATIDIPVGSLIVPPPPGEINGIQLLPEHEHDDGGVLIQVPLPEDSPDGGSTTTTEPHTDDEATQDAPFQNTGTGVSENPSAPTQRTDESSSDADSADETASPVDLNGATESSNPFNPTMAALLGALGSLAIVTFGFTAYRAGRRQS